MINIDETNRILREINESFLPFIIGHNQDINEHFNAFLKLFEKLDTSESGIYAVAPAFYKVIDFNSWEIEPFQSLQGYIKLEEKSFLDIFSFQTTLSVITKNNGAKKGFSELIIKELNRKNRLNGRINVLISNKIIGFKKKFCENDDSNSLYKFLVPKSLTNQVRSQLKDKNLSIELSVLEKGKQVKIYPKQVEVDSINEFSSIPKCSFNNPDKNEFVKKISRNVIQHSLYINDDIDLYYFFSNTVYDEKEKADYGLGGVFILVDKSITNENGKSRKYQEFIQLFERLVDKLANRIINHYQLENILNYARKSAFAEVNARTTSHNTGSHIMTNDLHKEKEDDILQFHNYLRQRMVYNSDITSGITSFEVEYKITDILDGFSKLEIVKKFVSGYENKTFNRFDKDGFSNEKVSLPNGVLGLQALYIIFENIIRNYFKHVGKTNELVVQVKLKENTDNHICLMLTDNSVPDTKTLNNIKRLTELPILEKDNKLRQSGLGLLEMKGAACYLNKIPIKQIDNPKIKVVTTEDETTRIDEKLVFDIDVFEDGKLWYIIWLRKPKDILILTDKKIRKKELLNKGIDLHSDIKNENYPHQWVVNVKGIDLDDDKKTELPPRIIVPNQMLPFDTILNDTDKLYPYWISILCKRKKITSNLSIFVDDFNQQKFLYVNSDEKKVFTIYFDNHGSNILDCNTFDYYEPFRSSPNPAGEILKNLDQYPNIEYELFETALVEVGIIDERIQRISLKEETDGMIENNSQNEPPLKIRDIYKKMRIYMPDKSEIDLNENNDTKQTLIAIKKWIKKTSMDFFIIHLTLVEKLMGADSVHDKEEISKWLNKNIFTCFSDTRQPNVIITTERGTPDKIPDNCRFLHYSNIVKYLVEDLSKFHFVKTLFNSRKTELL